MSMPAIQDVTPVVTSAAQSHKPTQSPEVTTTTLAITRGKPQTVTTSVDRRQVPTTTASVTVSQMTAPPAATSKQRKPWTLEEIRREIVRMLGSDVSNNKRFLFTSPAPTPVVVAPVTPSPVFHTPLPRPRVVDQQFVPSIRTVPDNRIGTHLPNTQFVSVSNILDRFYMSPLLLSLARSRSRPSAPVLPPGCDVNSDEFRCKSIGIHRLSPGTSKWCEINCKASNCVPFMCECGCEDKSKSRPTMPSSSCHAIAEFKGVEGMDDWCRANCKVGYCPANTCAIEDCLREIVF